jgi:hypothetical protein
MPKQTRKIVAATTTARQAKLTGRYADQDALYKALGDKGYQWDSKAGEWLYTPAMPSDEPTNLLRLRVWCAGERAKEMADGIAWAMVQAGCVLVEQSEPYPCRPPKQLESRVYLTLQLPERWQLSLRTTATGVNPVRLPGAAVPSVHRWLCEMKHLL